MGIYVAFVAFRGSSAGEAVGTEGAGVAFEFDFGVG